MACSSLSSSSGVVPALSIVVMMLVADELASVVSIWRAVAPAASASSVPALRAPAVLASVLGASVWLAPVPLASVSTISSHGRQPLFGWCLMYQCCGRVPLWF